MARKLMERGPGKVVVTGILQGEFIASYVAERGKPPKMIQVHKAGAERSGTGDVFASIIAADAVNGVDFEESVKKASDFVRKGILKSVEMDVPAADGVCFEEILYTPPFHQFPGHVIKLPFFPPAVLISRIRQPAAFGHIRSDNVRILY